MDQSGKALEEALDLFNDFACQIQEKKAHVIKGRAYIIEPHPKKIESILTRWNL
jgi:hypothetical protein